VSITEVTHVSDYNTA